MTTNPETEESAFAARRLALRSLGLGLAALVASPLVSQEAAAKKRGKKNRKKPAPPEDRCLPQVAGCEQVLGTYCETSANAAQCRTVLFPCCRPLGTCASDESLQCIFTALFTKA